MKGVTNGSIGAYELQHPDKQALERMRRKAFETTSVDTYIHDKYKDEPEYRIRQMPSGEWQVRKKVHQSMEIIGITLTELEARALVGANYKAWQRENL